MSNVAVMNWSQYVQININNQSYYLIQNLDDNLCLAINVADTLTDDESVGSVMQLYTVLVQLDGITQT